MCCWRFLPFFWLFSLSSGFVKRLPRMEKMKILSDDLRHDFIGSPPSPPTVLRTSYLWSNYHFNNNNPIVIQKKIDEWIHITRIDNNFIPVSVLVGLSGYISDKTALFTPHFWGAFSIIHIISAAGMVINDLFDMEADCINHYDRPLVQGTITEVEAATFVLSSLVLVPIIGYSLLPLYVAPFWWGAMAIVLLYSPILKKLFFVKNLACATVVASTVPFVAFSIMDPIQNLDLYWVRLTEQTIFMASLYIELLLDITDIQGDRENNIPTLPVIVGKDITLLVVTGIVSAGWINMLTTLYTYSVSAPILAGITLSYVPFYLNLWRIMRTNGSNSMIKNAIRQTTVSLVIYFASIIISNCY